MCVQKVKALQNELKSKQEELKAVERKLSESQDSLTAKMRKATEARKAINDLRAAITDHSGKQDVRPANRLFSISFIYDLELAALAVAHLCAMHLTSS